MTGRAGVLTAVSALVLAVVGCTGSSAETDRPATAPARTSGPLADGFEIEAGSSLIAAVFPASYGEGHQAILRVDGDLRQVAEGYVAQARELDFVFEEFYPSPQEPCGEPDGGPPQSSPVVCSATGTRPDGVRMDVQTIVRAEGRDYLLLRTGIVYDVTAPGPRVPDGPVAPATGSELGTDLTESPDDAVVRVVSGSRPLAGFPLIGCPWCTYVAVLEVSGDLAPVMRGYLKQFTATRFTGTGLVGNDEELSFAAEITGGPGVSAAAVSGDPSYVLIMGSPATD